MKNKPRNVFIFNTPGHARDYVEMQWLMMQQPKPDDYVIATGYQHTVREFVQAACKRLDISIHWQGTGIDEKGYDEQTGKCLVAVDPRYFRPTEVEALLGDPTKAKQQLGWQPHISFQQLVEEMVNEDFKLAEQDSFVQQKGFKTFNYHE